MTSGNGSNVIVGAYGACAEVEGVLWVKSARNMYLVRKTVLSECRT